MRVMRMPIPIKLSRIEIRSKEEALRYFKNILHRSFGSLTKEQNTDLIDLLRLHPDAGSKIGVGVREIIVDDDAMHSRCFYVVRVDGSRENFSFEKCINGEKSPMTLFSDACRRAAAEGVEYFRRCEFRTKNKGGMMVCATSGKLIHPKDAHVDHVKPRTFAFLVNDFIIRNGIDVETVEYVSDVSFGKDFKDMDLYDGFSLFHACEAVLRIVSAEENQRLASEVVR